jgi:hypothetical protein
MRLVRPLIFALVPVLTGCLHQSDRPQWLSKIPLLSPNPPANAAYLEYVLVERTAGGEEINRRVWDRIDEQVFPFETRTILEDAGLRVGIASESAPGCLRKLIDDPRTDRGHRGRFFALDKPAPLPVSDLLPRAGFTVPAAEGRTTAFSADAATLGFDITVRDAADGRVQVRLVPHAKYRDRSHLLPTHAGERDQATETFPGAAFEITLTSSDYLVIGTDWYWEHTFGHGAFTGQKDEREVQRLLVLRAGRTKAEPANSAQLGASAPPLAVQAATARGSRP